MTDITKPLRKLADDADNGVSLLGAPSVYIRASSVYIREIADNIDAAIEREIDSAKAYAYSDGYDDARKNLKREGYVKLPEGRDKRTIFPGEPLVFHGLNRDYQYANTDLRLDKQGKWWVGYNWGPDRFSHPDAEPTQPRADSFKLLRDFLDEYGASLASGNSDEVIAKFAAQVVVLDERMEA